MHGGQSGTGLEGAVGGAPCRYCSHHRLGSCELRVAGGVRELVPQAVPGAERESALASILPSSQWREASLRRGSVWGPSRMTSASVRALSVLHDQGGLGREAQPAGRTAGC